MRNDCPCMSGKDYTQCCEPYHLDTAIPATAEALMRSRYSAFTLGLIHYLIATLHPTKRRHNDIEQLRHTCENTIWLGLSIIDHKQSQLQAEVEFVAFYDDEPLGQLHERSRFTQEAGRWFYHDGIFLPPIKLGRNDRCICGSDKKFKLCHGAG